MSGTTAACAVFRGRLMFTANVGDSAVILGKVDQNNRVIAEVVTTYHKPYVKEEKERIEDFGGSVKLINREMRVIYEPECPSQRANDESRLRYRIPRLNLSRSLGDLWSFRENKGYLISPIPDVVVHYLDPTKHKFIILATDGVLDVMEPQRCAELVHYMSGGYFMHPFYLTKILINTALKEWENKGLRADNLSAVTAFIKDAAKTCED